MSKPAAPLRSVPAISLRSVVALVGRYPVLAGADLEVTEGEIVALTGPNGAGKTSLLRLIAGLLAIREGEAAVLGHDVRSHRRAVRAATGFVGHQPFLYDDLTVAENLAFFARTSERDALERLGIADRQSVSAGRLSAGQRRRLGVAIQLARRPRLWLLDEPHSGLDQVSRQVLASVLREVTSAGATVLFSTHDLAAVEDVAHRSVVVDGGVVTPVIDVPVAEEVASGVR